MAGMVWRGLTGPVTWREGGHTVLPHMDNMRSTNQQDAWHWPKQKLARQLRQSMGGGGGTGK